MLSVKMITLKSKLKKYRPAQTHSTYVNVFKFLSLFWSLMPQMQVPQEREGGGRKEGEPVMEA